jgi:hypothetical protein
VVYEPESSVLRTCLAGADLITCELALSKTTRHPASAVLGSVGRLKHAHVTYVQPQTLHRC